MKRLLAAGYGRIFQIAKCYRDGERGDRHLPEFTMLEWYRQAGDYRDLMAECEALLPFVLKALGRDAALVYRGERIDLTAPWERLSVAEAFRRFTRLTPEDALRTGCFDERMALDIEPRLGRGRPTFLYDYPAACAALARRKPTDPDRAERFELYVSGLELANAFSELTDAAQQRDRFAQARAERQRLGKADYPSAEPFLAALGAMPPAAGIALGVDRYSSRRCRSHRRCRGLCPKTCSPLPGRSSHEKCLVRSRSEGSSAAKPLDKRRFSFTGNNRRFGGPQGGARAPGAFVSAAHRGAGKSPARVRELISGVAEKAVNNSTVAAGGAVSSTATCSA